MSGRPSTAGDTVEVAHEALIRHWPALRRWLDEDRADLLVREAVREAAQEWDRHGRDESYLAHRGRRLAQAESLRQHRRLRLSPLEDAYLRASLALREREEEEREAQRQRELAAQRERAELAEQRAAEQAIAAARLRRRLLAALALGGLALLAAVGALAGFRQADEQRTAAQAAAATAAAETLRADAGAATAVAERDRAEAQTRLATSQRLAAEALNQLDAQPDLGLLLAVQASRTSDSFEARNSVMTALQSNPHLSAFLRGHPHGVDSVAFSRDGRTLASIGCGEREGEGVVDRCAEAEIRLWEAEAGAALGPPLRGASNGHLPFRLEFSPDGQTLATAECETVDQDRVCVAGGVRLWDVAARRPRGPLLVGHADAIGALAFSPDGTLLATAGGGTIVLWDLARGEPLGEPLVDDGRAFLSLAFHPDGGILAAGGPSASLAGGGSEIHLWDVATREPRGEPLAGHDSSVLTLDYSADGSLMASGGPDGILLWDAATWRPLGDPLTGGGAVQRIAFAPDGTTLVSGAYDGTVAIWDVAALQRRDPPLLGHTDVVSDVAFGRDGRFASASWDGTVILWDVSPPDRLGRPIVRFPTQVGEPRVSPDGRTIAVGGCGEPDPAGSACLRGAIRLWSAADGQPLREPLAGHHDVVTEVVFSADGTTMVSTSRDGTAIVWDVATWHARGAPLTDPNGMRGAVLSRNGQLLATSGEDGIVLWDVASGQPLGPPLIASDGGFAATLAFDPEGDVLAAAASGAASGTVILLDVATRSPIGTPLDAQTDAVSGLAFSADGRMLASSSQSMARWDTGASEGRNNVILWDVARHERLATLLPRSRFRVRGVSLSPDGALLAVGSLGGGITVWDIAARRPLGAPLGAQPGDARPLIFRPHGGQLLSVHCAERDESGACVQEEVRVWDVGVEAWRARACAVANRDLTPDEWRRFVSETLPYAPTCPDLPSGEGVAPATPVAAGRIEPATTASASPAPPRSASSPAASQPASGGAATPAARGGSSGVVGATYTSPAYGYGLAWDEAAWTVGEETSASGYDWLWLEGGAGFVSLEGYVYDGFARTPAAGCFQDAVAAVKGVSGVTSVVPAQAHERPDTGGARPGAAGLFAVTFSAETGGDDQEILYVECRSLGGAAVLKITTAAPVAGYERHRQAVGALLATLDAPIVADAPMGSATPLPSPMGTPVASTVANSRTASTSPRNGFAVSVIGYAASGAVAAPGLFQ